MISVTAFTEIWKYRNAELAYLWDVEDYDQEEQPRPEYLRSYRHPTVFGADWRGEAHGGRGHMRL